MGGFFKSSLEHLQAELKRTEFRLDIAALRQRQARQDSCTMPPGNHTNLASELAGTALKLSDALHRLDAVIERKKEASRAHDIRLRLDELVQRFNLSRFELNTILICLLAELEPDCRKLMAYLNRAGTRTPNVDLVLGLLCDSVAARLAARQAFSDSSALMRNRLVRLHSETAANEGLAASLLIIEERVVRYLLGDDQPEARLNSCVRLIEPGLSLDEIILDDSVKTRLKKLVGREMGLVCYLTGDGANPGIAAAICGALHLPLMAVDIDALSRAEARDSLIPLVVREARLQGAALYLDLSKAPDESSQTCLTDMRREIDRYDSWIFIAGKSHSLTGGRESVTIDIPAASYEQRLALWAAELDSPSEAVLDLAAVAGRFRLNGEQVKAAAGVARSLALWRDPDDPRVSDRDLFAACRQQSRHKLSTLARKIEPHYTWDDIVLPRDQIEQLRELCAYVKNYQLVYGSWGFGQKLSLGKGLNALFAGPPGTGKTMAAEIMADELGLDVYKVDLSVVVSKYVGETEKNLDRIFSEGKVSNAILFFDEADALFGKRSEVRDAHDRYANIEIAYLLQKMEEYDGVVILATNLRKNMDEAFARRMHFTVEFPVPEEPERYRIWQIVFPDMAPLANDIDLAFLARQFRLAGGSIKNIAVTAAFLAAENGGSITMEKIIKATRREYQKLGKLCTEGDFDRYFNLVKV